MEKECGPDEGKLTSDASEPVVATEARTETLFQLGSRGSGVRGRISLFRRLRKSDILRFPPNGMPCEEWQCPQRGTPCEEFSHGVPTMR